jgi:hypothetical protein
VLNFTRFWKFILLNLDYLCKRYKRNMKTENNKKKGEEKKKRKEKRIGPNSPVQPSTNQAQGPPDWWTPRVRFSPNLGTASLPLSQETAMSPFPYSL